MHVLQPKHIKLKPQEVKLLLEKLNLTLPQLPKIKRSDAALPSDAKIGDIIKIERKNSIYYRAVAP